jgi:multidrug transporter EmrE-like cation transporter
MHRVYIIILTIAIIEACGQYCIKKGSIEKHSLMYYIGLISYITISYLLLKTYEYKGIGFSNLLWSSISIILACITGKIFFGEQINYLACILVICAVYILIKTKLE